MALCGSLYIKAENDRTLLRIEPVGMFFATRMKDQRSWRTFVSIPPRMLDISSALDERKIRPVMGVLRNAQFGRLPVQRNEKAADREGKLGIAQKLRRFFEAKTYR